MIYDLHVHTRDSDGKYSRLELLQNAEKMKLKYLSFTDHDYISTENIKSEYEKLYGKCNVTIIDGVEFTVNENKNMHVLGYDIKNIKLVDEQLKKIEKNNIDVCLRLIENLNNYYHFNLDLKEYSNYRISKGLIRRMIFEKGYTKSILEAGIQYTGVNSKFYEEISTLKLDEIIRLVKKSDGILVLAHPSTLNLSNSSLDNYICELKKMGLDGIEVLNTSKTTIEQMKFYEILANKYDLLMTCGSDYHCEDQSLGINNEKSKKLIKIIKER